MITLRQSRSGEENERERRVQGEVVSHGSVRVGGEESANNAGDTPDLVDHSSIGDSAVFRTGGQSVQVSR